MTRPKQLVKLSVMSRSLILRRQLASALGAGTGTATVLIIDGL